MGEIDRISPISLQPLLGLHGAQRVQPESDKNQRHPQKDELELSNTDEDIEDASEDPEAPPAVFPTGHLDIAI